MLSVSKFRIAAAGSIISAIAVYGQLRPDTAIEGFRLPLFDDSGYRIWQLRGDLATYRSETQIQIDGMKVSQFIGDDENREIAELTSPEAVFHFDTTTAYGPGELHVKTGAFEVTGYDWLWLGEQKQINFNRDVKVTLYEQIGDILK
ncbi:hypothetical protein [Pelagicoccus albus]|uniref:LPS export ABC transporter protein LptC n=1 Tax=Pelagicoccus albus TaxID=415222 RepID=A0A7X1B5R9_9BACT|nr:hypothetical protein [Pelagicoccus albus]MBC2605053.1 hypothetical protein [Pelagicoccus albus]